MAKRTPYGVSTTDLCGQLSLGMVALSNAVPVEDGPRRSWIQLAITGSFYSPKYGAFAISPEDLTQVVKNFAAITPKEPTQLCIDYNHGTAKPEQTPESAKAAGWVETLELRNDGRELWALVEWTEEAETRIAAKEYRFISPVLAFHYQHSSGRDIGTTLLSAALTNTPFLEGMAPVTLSRDYAVAVPAHVPVEDPMPEALILAKFSFAETGKRVGEAIEKTIPMCPHCKVSSFRASWMPPESAEMPALSAMELYDDHAIARCMKCASFCKLSYEINADSGHVTLTGSPVEVIANYEVVAPATVAASKTPTGAGTMPIKVKTVAGDEVEVEEALIVGLAKDTAGVELAKKFETLNQSVVALTSQNAALRSEVDEFKTKETERAIADVVEGGIRAGKVAPAERESLVTLAKANLDAVKALIDVRPVAVKLDKATGSDAAGATVSASMQVTALAKDVMAANPKLTREEAFNEVFSQNADLYEAYVAEASIKV